MKKILTLIVALGLSTLAFARPPHGPGFGLGPRPHYHHHHHHSAWVAGSFFGGALLGTAIANAVAPAPVVVSPAPVYAPGPVVYAPPRVWVPGHYETRYVNGFATSVWVPGYWR